MTKNTWIILAAVVVGVGLIGGAALLMLVSGFFTESGEARAASSSLPVYASAQVPSSHPGYLRNTLTRGDDVYVSDYEEACLELVNPEPSTVIGVIVPMGVSKVCSIPGQPTTAWIAGDCGGEMPAYAPYRNSQEPPFDWRKATFREMKAYDTHQSLYLTTTNAALMAELGRTLRYDPPVKLPGFSFASIPGIPRLKLSTDALPGLLFCPYVFTDAKGQIYLAESIRYDMSTATNPVSARWIPASPALTTWLKSKGP